jgi:peptide/nickel transport system permease protein
MGRYVLKRVFIMIPTLFAISIVAFLVIQLPPGDYLTTIVRNMEEQGQTVTREDLAALKEAYGLGQPVYVQYAKWMARILTRGDFGRSFSLNRPVGGIIWERIGLTFLVSFATMLFTWAVAMPIGVYSAVRQYSPGDYIATFVGFLGLAIPDFLLALVLMYIGFKVFRQSVGGLFSPAYVNASWSLARAADLLGHLWIPVVVIGTSGTASLIRILRANLLDELRKVYVTAARARGLKESTLLVRYPLRVAMNPFVSTIGWALPHLVSGTVVTGIVLNLPTTGPVLLNALKTQDMYLAAAFILMLSVLTVIGTLLSDILLVLVDPRIRYVEAGE